MVSSSSSQQPHFAPNPIVFQGILLLALFNQPISSRILQANAFMKILYRAFLLSHRIATLVLLLYTTTRLLVYVVSSLEFVRKLYTKHHDGRQPLRWTVREVAASLHWMIAFALSSAAWSHPSGSSSIWGTLEEIIAVLPFALCAPPVIIQLLSLLSFVGDVYLWSRDRAEQNNIFRPSPYSNLQYVLMTVSSVVAIMVAVSVARMNTVHNREGPNLCAILPVLLEVFAGLISITQLFIFEFVILGWARGLKGGVRQESGTTSINTPETLAH